MSSLIISYNQYNTIIDQVIAQYQYNSTANINIYKHTRQLEVNAALQLNKVQLCMV